MATRVDDRKLHSRHRNAYLALYIIGGLTLVLGLLTELARIEVLLQIFGSGWLVAIEGLVMLILGYFTMRGSIVALSIAIALYLLDTISTVALAPRSLSGIWIRLLVLYFLIQGLLALREIKRRQRAATSPAASSTATSGPHAGPGTS